MTKRCKCPRPGYELNGCCTKCGFSMRPTASIIERIVAALAFNPAAPSQTDNGLRRW